MLTDPREIALAVENRRRLAEQRGVTADDATGLVFADEYVTIHRDPVQFRSSGAHGTHLTIGETAAVAGVAGVVVVPTDGRIVHLLRIYRHPVRDWLWEFPRGYLEHGLTAEQNARKELQEELGMTASRCVQLGVVHSNSGLLSSSAVVFHATPSGVSARTPEATEVLGEHRAVDLRDFEAMIRDGQITDGFTLAAITLAAAHGVFSRT